MRYMKRLLLGIYLYMGAFFAACYVSWLITGDEPTSLIAGVAAAVGVESIAAGILRINENREQHKHEKEMYANGEECGTAGDGGEDENRLGTETDEP